MKLLAMHETRRFKFALFLVTVSTFRNLAVPYPIHIFTIIMAACIGVEKLLESNKCLVILSLCHFLSFLSAEQDVSESMLVLSFMKITFYTFVRLADHCSL